MTSKSFPHTSSEHSTTNTALDCNQSNKCWLKQPAVYVITAYSDSYRNTLPFSYLNPYKQLTERCEYIHARIKAQVPSSSRVVYCQSQYENCSEE